MKSLNHGVTKELIFFDGDDEKSVRRDGERGADGVSRTVYIIYAMLPQRRVGSPALLLWEVDTRIAVLTDRFPGSSGSRTPSRGQATSLCLPRDAHLARRSYSSPCVLLVRSSSRSRHLGSPLSSFNFSRSFLPPPVLPTPCASFILSARTPPSLCVSPSLR